MTDTKLKICDGNCDQHEGEVVPVKVCGMGWGELEFNYCEVAIKADVKNGFLVEVL